MSLIGETLKSLDDGHMVLAVFVDLKKAFDTVPLQLIIDKLMKIGVRDLELDWFRSYLTNH